MNCVRVVLADDHTLVRQGIKTLLEPTRFRVVGEVRDGHALVKLAQETEPSLLLVDVSMPELNGIEAVRRIRRFAPDLPVVFLSMYNDKDYVRQASAVGANGYVMKNEAPSMLIEAIERVLAGKTYFPAPPCNDGDAEAEDLTPREREVLQLIAEGKKNKEIASLLHRSVHTVRNHRARLMRKLDAHTGTELVEAANALGLVRLETPTDSL